MLAKATSSPLVAKKDQEILGQWLRSIHFEEYLSLFVNSGYDMPTISRMTPEDLTAIGITKPTHRRKLFTEISKLNISDGIPDYKPDSLSLMLKLLRLEEYETTLVSQGYDSVDKVAELTWEDIDDIGIRKLGHQKKLTLAIRKIKNFPRFQPAFRPIPPSSSSHQSLARHSSIDLGNPHARPITVPVPPDQFDQQWTTMPPLQHSVSQTDSFTYPHLRQVNSGTDLHKQDIDEQMYFAWQQQTDNMFAQQQALRGRSLESLEQNFEWYDMVNSWRTQMMADQSQLIEGTSTLNRPRGLIKARPVAKVQGTSTVSIRDQISLDGEDISKPDLLAGQGPIPPKRLMSSGVVKAHDVGDTAFATCVQSLTSRFTLDTREDQLDNIDDEPALALQLSSPNQIPRPPPPEPPPTPTKPSAPQRDKSPIPSGDVSQVAPQVIELNHAMQSELKMKLKQRNHQASTGSSLAASAPLKPGQDRPKQSGAGGGGGAGMATAAKSEADLEREKFLAKLESVRKKSERKEEAKTGGKKLNTKTEQQNSGSDASDKERSQNQGTPRLKNDHSSNHSANINNAANSNNHHNNSNGASIDKEIRSLQECIQASVMEPTSTQRRGEALEDDANDYDTNPFTALLSKIEKNIDKEFLERKRNEKAAASDVASPTPERNLSQASTSTSTTNTTTAPSIQPSSTSSTSTSKTPSSLPSSATTQSVSAKIDKINSIEVKLVPSVGAVAAPSASGTALPAATINNLNKERPYEIARSTKTEPVIQNKFFSTIGVETKVINLEDRPHRKSDAGLPSARCNIVGDNQRRTSVSEVGKGAATQHQQNGVNRVPASVLDAAQLQAAQAEFDNKFGNLNVSKESEKDKKIIEIQEALEEQREGLVSSARRIFEVCAKASSGNSANSSPAVPRRNSVRKEGKDGATSAASPAPPVPHPRTRPPDVPPRNPRNVEEQSNSPPVPLRLPAKNPRRVPETPKVIQDIEHMLSSLTDQLDAMLD